MATKYALVACSAHRHMESATLAIKKRKCLLGQRTSLRNDNSGGTESTIPLVDPRQTLTQGTLVRTENTLLPKEKKRQDLNLKDGIS